MTKLDVLCVVPGGKEEVYQELHTKKLTAVHPPVDSLMLAKFLQNQNKSVAILDANALNLGPNQATEKIPDYDPKLIVVSVEGNQVNASTQTMPAAGAVVSAIKEKFPQQKIIMVGHHPTALPQRTLEEEKTDFIVASEPYYTTLDLLNAFDHSQSPDLSAVRGLYWRKDDQIIANPAAPLVDPSTEIGGFAYDLLPPLDKFYRAHNWQDLKENKRSPYVEVQTTFGCRFHCHFCMIQVQFRAAEKAMGYHPERTSYRFMDPKIVVDQIEKLVVEYGSPMFVRIYDEMFVLDRNHVTNFCNEIINRGLSDKLKIWAYARVDTTQPDMLDLLRKAGFEILAYGIESGSTEVRGRANKRFTQEKVLEIIDRVHQAGINIIGNYIIGLPSDSKKTYQETLDLARRLNTFWINVYAAMAYPGSQLYKEAVEKNWKLPPHWGAYAQHGPDTFPLATEFLTNGQVLTLRDRFFEEYFTYPPYLKMMEEKFGPFAVEQIKQMTTIPLKRNFAEPVE